MERQAVVKALFWVLVAAALVVAGAFFFPPFRELVNSSRLFLLPPAVFSVLGLALAAVSWRALPAGWLRRCLLLTGLSAAGFLVSIVLHNAFYALAQVTGEVAVLNRAAEILHAAFFIAAILVCPPAFVAGALASVVLFARGHG